MVKYGKVSHTLLFAWVQPTKYLEKVNEISFDKIFNQTLGKFLIFGIVYHGLSCS